MSNVYFSPMSIIYFGAYWRGRIVLWLDELYHYTIYINPKERWNW
jgi:hypothetical protein